MANYINFTKATFNPYNPKVLNEGQFSWMTQDTGDQIGSEAQNTIDVYMYDNQGNQWYEKRYEGYGEFGGMDYYELLARMNGYSEEDLEDKKVLKAMSYGKEMRDIGISLAFDKLKTKDRGRKTLFPALVSDPKFNWKRHDFTQEAESDPNQSWYQEPEYDDYEDEYYESEKPELTWDSLKESLGLNEAKKMSIGDQGVDYNDNVVEIVAIGNFKKIAKMFKKEMKEDAADWGYEEGAGDFYLTKTIETEEGNVGDLAIYPVKYDMANYWGLDPLSESVVTEAKFNKRSLMRAMKKDDGFIQLGNGQEYIIYNPNNGNQDNADMWDDKVIFALDQDGEEHEIKYSDIVS